MCSSDLCMVGSLVEDSTGEKPFAYATQGKKQIMVKQSKDPQKNETFYAVCYLNESGDLYATTSQKLPTKLSDLTGWKKAKDMGATEKDIDNIKLEMAMYKQGTCISDKVLPETFVSQTANGTYVETMNVKIGNAIYDYAFAFLPNGNVLRVAIGSGQNIFYIFQPASGTRIKACPAETFPNF